jgi:uncharacterized protein (TIGR03067 family)
MEGPAAMTISNARFAAVALLANLIAQSSVAIGLAHAEANLAQAGQKSAPPGDATARSPETQALKELDGDWRMIQFEADGEKQSVKDKGWIWNLRQPLLRRTGPDGKPLWSVVRVGEHTGHLDLIPLEGDLKGDLSTETLPGIFKLDRGKLIVCLRHETRVHLGRPVDFTTRPDSWQLLFTFERCKDPRSLKGTWEVTEMYVNGSRLDQLATRVRTTIDRRVVFSDSTMRAESLADGKRIETPYKLDPGKDPKQILLGGSESKTIPGIYRVDFDTLRLCFDDQAKEAPKEFTSREDNRQSLWILKRVKSP